ncbi:type II toxin-antitoxin system VapC family toxin [Botrimarina sp.]|uniref:type II toxin-antitoxin system VapC family toxin n=1 Tax=Botrimarina sp. TaxID=2795802 RepID=UPI0032F09B7D
MDSGYARRPREEVDRTLRHCVLLTDVGRLAEEWLELVTQNSVSGKAAHDARLVAAMQTHGVRTIVTFNPRDFDRYSQLVVVTPESVVAGSADLGSDGQD